jgi:hypothetical protein
MFKRLVALSIFTGLAAASWAQEAPPAGQCTKGTFLDEATPALQAPTASSPLVFYRYPANAPGQGGQRLTVRVFVDGALLLTESVETAPDDRAEPVVELLSRDPARLREIHGLAGTPGRVGLEFTFPDGSVRTADFEEIVAESRALVATGLLPQRVTASVAAASVESTGPMRATSSSCQTECYQRHDTCSGACEGRPGCLARCDRQLQACLRGCGCEPVSWFTTETEVLSRQYAFDACVNWWGDSQGRRYQIFRVNYKQTTIKITQNCDGTQTREIVDVTYGWYPCRGGFFENCSNPDRVDCGL